MTARNSFLRSLTATLCGATVALSPLALSAQTQGRRTTTASDKELIAVLEMEGTSTEKPQVLALTERFREELLKSGRFTLVDRAQMDSVLKEQALQQTGCTSQECAVQVGKVLGVRKIVTGRVTKIEDTLWLLSATMVDVETAETQRAESYQHEGNFRTLLSGAIGQLAAKIAQGASAAPPVAATLPPAPSAPPPAPIARAIEPPPAPKPEAAQPPAPAIPPPAPVAQAPAPSDQQEIAKPSSGGIKWYWWALGGVLIAGALAAAGPSGGAPPPTGGVSYTW